MDLWLRGTAAMPGTRDPRDRDIDQATAGLLAAWVVHDLEELATMAHESRATLAELPKGVPVPRSVRDQLRAIQEGADQSTRELIDDIIAGRASLRDLTQTQFSLDRFAPLARISTAEHNCERRWR